jgi:hypothetical protein
MNSSIGAACIGFISATMAELPFTRLVSLTREVKKLNRDVRIEQQSGTQNFISNAVSQPYTYAGLLGTNEIAAIADTGVDQLSCYFFDSLGQVPYSPISTPIFNNSFRKVVQYTYVTDTGDVANGHGTSISGAVLGSVEFRGIFDDASKKTVLQCMNLQFSLLPFRFSYSYFFFR